MGPAGAPCRVLASDHPAGGPASVFGLGRSANWPIAAGRRGGSGMGWMTPGRGCCPERPGLVLPSGGSHRVCCGKRDADPESPDSPAQSCRAYERPLQKIQSRPFRNPLPPFLDDRTIRRPKPRARVTTHSRILSSKPTGATSAPSPMRLQYRSIATLTVLGIDPRHRQPSPAE